MKNDINRNSISWLVGLLACILFAGLIGWNGGVNAHKDVEPVIKYVEVMSEQMFDTSVIEAKWCGDFTEGTIRMIGAWYYADGVVEDETGELWGLDVEIAENDFLLLWIADNNTPNKTADDIIIKTWREAY